MDRRAAIGWGALWLAMRGRAAAQSADEPPVLVIDFVGANDNHPRQHAESFRDFVLAGAEIITIGFKGVIPDDRSQAERLSLIVPDANAAERARAVERIGQLIVRPRTVLAFDFNELLPQQLRGSMPAWLPSLVPGLDTPLQLARLLPNKIERPAAVAAASVQQWLQAHPGGRVVLRGHSDGTYAVAAVFDALAALGIAPDAVVLESLRQDYADWRVRAMASPQTRFIEIAARNDLVPVSLLQFEPPPTALPNWTHYRLTASVDPLRAHSSVTEFAAAPEMVRTDHRGSTAVAGIALGLYIAADLRDLFAPGERPRPQVAAYALPPRPAAAPPKLQVYSRAAEDLMTVLSLADRALPDSAKVPAGLRRGLHRLQASRELGQALGLDIEQASAGGFTVLSSHTLQALAGLGLGLIEKAGESPAGHPPAAAWLAARIGPLKTLAGALGSVAGGQFGIDELRDIVGGTAEWSRHEILQAIEKELSRIHGPGPSLAASRALKQWEGRLLFFDAIGDIAAAVALQLEAGQTTLAVVDQASTAVIKLAASVIVIPMILSPWAELAPVARDAIVEAAVALRDRSAGSSFWAHIYAATYGNRFQALELYAEYQARQVRLGRPVDDFDVFLPREELRRLGYDDREIAVINAQNRLFNLHLGFGPKPQANAAPKPAQDFDVISRFHPRHPERARLKPRRHEPPPWPPGRRPGPPGAGGGGPGAGGGGAGGRRDDDPGGGGGSVALKGVTVDAQPRYEDLGAARRAPVRR